jgi:hypothetical protein
MLILLSIQVDPCLEVKINKRPEKNIILVASETDEATGTSTA